jgi:hypothetical protein
MSSIIRATTTSGLQIAPDNSGSLQLQTNGTTTAVTIDTSQNVGIGTASPAYKLDVNRGSNGVVAKFTGTASSYIYGSTTASYFAGDVNAYTSYGVDSTNDILPMYTNNVERMRIDSSGNIYAGGTTSLANGPYRYNSISNFSTAYGLGIQDTSAGVGGYFIGFMNQSNVVQGSISKTSSTVTAYNTGSDYRLKEDILPMTGALDRIAQLKPVTFKWKEDKLDGEGFIAHELAEVCPQCVTGEKDAVDTKGNPRYQMVDTSFLVATLTAAIQEQQTIINDLKARVKTLEAK